MRLRLGFQGRDENEKADRIAIRKSWIEALPEKVGDFIVDKEQCGVCDSIGNFLFGLPVDPVENFKEWVRGELDEFFACEE